MRLISLLLAMIAFVCLSVVAADKKSVKTQETIKPQEETSLSVEQENEVLTYLSQSEKDRLGQIKEKNPQTYYRYLLNIKKDIPRRKRDAQRDEILTQVREGKITQAQAREKLLPIVSQEAKEQMLDSIDQKIKNIQQHMEMLKQQLTNLPKEIDNLIKIKNNPDNFIKQRIDQYINVNRPAVVNAPAATRPEKK